MSSAKPEVKPFPWYGTVLVVIFFVPGFMLSVLVGLLVWPMVAGFIVSRAMWRQWLEAPTFPMDDEP